MVDILLVEDQEELSGLMSRFFVKAGYSVYRAGTGEMAMEFLQEEIVRLVILDVMLPGIDGFGVCSFIRKRGDIPVMILSAAVDKEAKMNGYQFGADDYIEKPVDMDLLIMKVSAVFKRYYEVHDKISLIKSGDLMIDQEKMEVRRREKKLNLTGKEYDLLTLLAENAGKTLNKDYLFNRIWGASSLSEAQTLTVHIKMLRDKIEEDPRHPKKIITVWGVGYRYEEIS